MKAIAVRRRNPRRPNAVMMLVVRGWTIDPGPEDQNRMEQIYAQNPELVREPRSFRGDRLRQALRWLSMVSAPVVQRGTEIQCYYEDVLDAIIVSSNSKRDNGRINAFLSGSGLEEALSRLPESEMTDVIAPVEGQDPVNERRLRRHEHKLVKRLDPSRNPHAGSMADPVLAAIRNRRFVVPTRRYRLDGKEIDLHAERRIRDYLDENDLPALRHSQLAGIKRTCMLCAHATGSQPCHHRGPAFSGASAEYELDMDDIVVRNVRDGIGTSVTRTRHGTLTFAHDTDSDSDA